MRRKAAANGRAYIAALTVSDEPWLARTRSSAGGRVAAFRDAVRARDGGCVITKTRPTKDAGGPSWTSLEPAHIFPLAHKAHWDAHDYGRWVAAGAAHKEDAINSVQNGIMLRTDMRSLFEDCLLSINPDVGASLCALA